MIFSTICIKSIEKIIRLAAIADIQQRSEFSARFFKARFCPVCDGHFSCDCEKSIAHKYFKLSNNQESSAL